MKILIIGDRDTGKSSYIKNLLNMDIEQYTPTDGILIAQNLNLQSNKGQLHFDIYDCSTPIGTEIKIENIIGILLFINCIHICDIQSWIDYALSISNNIIICNNKIELPKHVFNDTIISKYLKKNIDYTTLSCIKKWNIEIPLEKLFKLYFNDYEFSLKERSGKEEKL